MALKEWYKEWFSSPYYEILYHKRNEEEAAAFIQRLLQYLNPEPGSRMLDVACGKGRHSSELADMGFDVTGIDLSEPSISEALKKIKANTLIVGIQSDLLFPIEEQVSLAAYIPHAKLELINSKFGHDGFLIEFDQMLRLVEKFMKRKLGNPINFVI